MLNKKNNHKKAAMFGLDARIALAIFGTLSVISGAALYSAIQNAKATALLANMRELGKAWEQYYLDTGTNVGQIITNDPSTEAFYLLQTIQLVKNPGIKGWKGPYLNYTEESGIRNDIVGHPSYPYFGMWLAINNNGTWGDNYDFRNDITTSSGYCLSGETCSIWVYLIGIEDLSIIAKVDEMVDNSDGGSLGNLRWNTFPDLGGVNRVLLKIAPIKNPND